MNVQHTAKTVPGGIPGTWVSICSCGWRGKVHGVKGARTSAVDERYQHLEDVGA